MSEEMTLGDVYWTAFAAADRAYEGRVSFSQLAADVQAAIEAGAHAVADAAIRRRIDELEAHAAPVSPDLSCTVCANVGGPHGVPAAERYALVEQMGHRATTATVREVTFCGAPMLEVTDLKTGSVHLAAPQSLYEVTWLTEDEARTRAKPWTAQAITVGDDDPEVAENGGVWGFTEADL
jgi:hypothetical protein